MIRKGWLLFVTLLMIVAMVLGACGPEEEEPVEEPTTAEEEAPTVEEKEPEPGEKVTLKLATWAGVDEANELQEILDGLNAESDSYEIIQESSPAEYYTKLQTTFAAGTAADLMWVDQDHLPDFAEKGALLDITDYLSADDHPAADLDDYFDSPLDRYTYNGRIYGLPWIAMPVMLYVNLDHLEAAGLDEGDVNDWDWDAFQEACIAMTMDSAGNHPGDDGFDASDVQQYGFSVVPGWPPVQMWIWQAGGEVLSSDLSSSPIDSAEAVAGAQYLADLINTYQCTPEQSVISERGFGEMMNGGQVSMFMGGAADDFERKEGVNIKAFLLPQGPANRDTWAWIGGMSIYAGTEYPGVAYEAFVDLTQAIHEWKVPAPRASMATREGIIAATPYKEVSADNIIANMPNMHAPYIFPGYAQWATVFGERFVDPLVRGAATAANLAPEVRPLLDDVLAGVEMPEPEPGEKVTLKLATWAGVDEANELQEILDRLNAESDSYEIIQESSPAEYYTKLQTTFAAGTAADLMWVDQDHLPDFAEKGALLDITDYLSADDHPAADLDDYFDSPLDRYTYNGRIYGLPWIAMPVMLYVNLDHLEAAGLDEADVNDWDWDGFQEACIAMTMDSAGNHPGDDGFDASDVQQYGFSVVPGWPPVQMWIWQAGGEVLSSDLSSSPIDSAEAVAGAQYLADLINTYQCTPEQSVISERGFGEMMKGGQVSMFMGGAADDFERTEGVNIKAFLLPQGPANRDTWAWIGGMSIYADTANPDAAYEAFMDLTQAIHEWKVPAPRASMATREGIIAATPYKEVSADNIIANMPNMHAPYIFPGYAQWATVFGERFVDPLVRGNDTAANLAPEVRPLLEDVLSEVAP